MKGCNNMNKEKIKEFWDLNKELIIGGALVLTSLVIVGVSVGSAMKANSIKIKNIEATEMKQATAYAKWVSDFQKECSEIGAEIKEGIDFPFATKEVVEKFLDKGSTYQLDQFGDDIYVVWITGVNKSAVNS